MEPDDEIWSTMNHTQINTTGIEFFVHISNLKIPLFRSISAGYNYMITDKQSNTLLSYYALDYLKHKATVSVVQSIYKNFGASWAIIWQDRAGSYAQYPLGIEVAYNSFWLANLRMNWQGRGIEVYTDINNLGNVSHIDIGNIPLSGRWLSFGIRVQLD
jgi:vitamin B12 transporter